MFAGRAEALPSAGLTDGGGQGVVGTQTVRRGGSSEGDECVQALALQAELPGNRAFAGGRGPYPVV